MCTQLKLHTFTKVHLLARKLENRKIYFYASSLKDVDTEGTLSSNFGKLLFDNKRLEGESQH